MKIAVKQKTTAMRGNGGVGAREPTRTIRNRGEIGIQSAVVTEALKGAGISPASDVKLTAYLQGRGPDVFLRWRDYGCL